MSVQLPRPTAEWEVLSVQLQRPTAASNCSGSCSDLVQLHSVQLRHHARSQPDTDPWRSGFDVSVSVVSR